MITQVLDSSAVWGVLLTLAAFGLGVLINKRTGKAIFNPLLLGTAFVIVVLSVLNIPYDTYAASASPISYLLLPATVSLAVPLYEKLGSAVQKAWWPLWPVCWPELWQVCSACWHWPCCWT